ncbi:MAG: nucleotidyltransferase domain-containing protein [Candidatus Diapherotrites archaeon]|nr:nucleotidyltransferase domain-containing protein [Candidatus Diapherotrites archaeon]
MTAQKIEQVLGKDFAGIFERLFKDNDVVSVSLCGSYGRADNRKDSDIDLFIVGRDWQNGNVQVVHYITGKTRLDVMLFDYERIVDPEEVHEKLLTVLLKKSRIVFCKDERVRKALMKFSDSSKKYSISESEIQSIWYNLIWNLSKARSYQETIPDLSQIVCIESFYLIGLCYAKMLGIESYSFAESLKIMREKNPLFWQKYLLVLQQEDKISGLTALLSDLPNADKRNLRSFIELDGFISPITVIVSSSKNESFKKYMDNLVLDNG